MSPVCGIISNSGDDVTGHIDTMMRTFKNPFSDIKWIATGNDIYNMENAVRKPCNRFFGQSPLSLREQPDEKPSVSDKDNITVVFDGNLYNRELLKSELGISDNSITNSEIVLTIIRNGNYSSEDTMLTDLQSRLDGPFCLIINKDKRTIVTRDINGLRPLFYAYETEKFAYASKKQPLWSAGFQKVSALRAGKYAVINGNQAEIKKLTSTNKSNKQIGDMDVTVERYSDLLVKAINKRLTNLKRVGVLLSGGVDSGLLAWLVCKAAKKQGIEVIAYTAGMVDAEDLHYSEQLAWELDVKHRIKILNEDDIRRYIQSVLQVVEERDIVQIEAGIGVYSALELAAKDGIRSIFSGQGPDELWGGYTWYPEVLKIEGYEGLIDKMDDDLQRGDIETFDRENKIALAYSAEQLFPYVDNEITELASIVSPRLKVKSPDDKLGKHPHRQAATRLGLPEKYAKRAKNAAQHGTGVHDFLGSIALQEGFSPELVKKIGYKSTDISQEKLASSTRYGYKFDNAELWAVPQHIQLYLDTLAYKNSLLNYSEREKIEIILKDSRLN